MNVKILVERIDGTYVATSFDEVGKVATGESTDRATAIALCKDGTRAQLKGTIHFTVDNMRLGK